MRTTIDIDEPILSRLKALQGREGKSLGRLVSDLLAVAIRDHDARGKISPGPLAWTTKPMGARVDLADREALYDLMDEADEQ